MKTIQTSFQTPLSLADFRCVRFGDEQLKSSRELLPGGVLIAQTGPVMNTQAMLSLTNPGERISTSLFLKHSMIFPDIQDENFSEAHHCVRSLSNLSFPLCFHRYLYQISDLKLLSSCSYSLLPQDKVPTHFVCQLLRWHLLLKRCVPPQDSNATYLEP